jgi:cell division protein FtsL
VPAYTPPARSAAPRPTSAAAAAPRPASAGAAATAAAAAPLPVRQPAYRPGVAPRTPAPRTPGRRQRVRITQPRPAGSGPLLQLLIAQVRSLPERSVLDKVIRGRVWIPLLGILLVGIVAMQVEVLKLNAGIGGSMARSAALESQNQSLRAEVAQLSSDSRIESLAAGMGMVVPTAAATKFLGPGSGRDLTRVLAGVHAPDATSFTAALLTRGAAALAATVAEGVQQLTTPTIGSTGTSGTTSGSTGTTGTTTGSTSTTGTTAGTTTGATAGTTTTAGATSTTAAGTSSGTPATTGTTTGQTTTGQTTTGQITTGQTTGGVTIGG